MIVVCIAQLVLTVQRQIFDFLGYMWAPIIGNFFQIIFVIFGLFGVYQYRPKYVAIYVIWTIMWLGWNVFMICFYLEIGYLNREQGYLNLGTGSRSWFEVNGLGCKALYDPNTPDEMAGFIKPSSVDGCVLDYFYVECLQAALQTILALVGFLGGVYIIYVYTQEDPSSVRRKRLHGLHPASTSSLPYSIEYHHVNKYNTSTLSSASNASRRMRRRSHRANRSQRASYQNPVTKLIDKYVDTSSQDSYNHLSEYIKAAHPHVGHIGQVNPGYEQSRYSIASSGTYGVVDPYPAPPHYIARNNETPM